MRYVLLRDDDTNALTPVECLERMYRPFLDRGLPVNLAVIPNVRADAIRPDGEREEFVLPKKIEHPTTNIQQPTFNQPPTPDAGSSSISDNVALVRYLRDNPGFHVAQHGYDHSLFEFDSHNPADIGRRLDEGTRLLQDAGFAKPETFVAPYDKLSSASFREVAKRFRVLSTGWFELRRLPLSWWPNYAAKKISDKPHWKIGDTLLLSHPGCLLSCFRETDSILDAVRREIQQRDLTVLVTHWWEYFRGNGTDAPMLNVLHSLADLLANDPNIRVISFAEVAGGLVEL